MLGEDDEGGEAWGGLPDEAGVGGEPGDVALVAAVEEDGAAGSSPPTAAAHQVPLLEERPTPRSRCNRNCSRRRRSLRLHRHG